MVVVGRPWYKMLKRTLELSVFSAGKYSMGMGLPELKAQDKRKMNIYESCSTISRAELIDRLADWPDLCVHSPRSDVARAYDRFAGATKDACEIVALIATCLYVVRELHDHDISQCVTILSQSQKDKKT